METQLSYGWQAYEQQTGQVSTYAADNARLKLELDQSKDSQWQYWRQIEQLQTELANTRQQQEQLQLQQQTHHHESNNTGDINLELQELKRNLDESLAERTRLSKDLVDIKKEQDDLLVLLADQDVKLKEYRRRLKNVGADDEITGDDDDDDDEDFDDDEEVSKGTTSNEYRDRNWDNPLL